MTDSDKIIIIDLEATCWKGDPPTGQIQEIIEIGLAVLHTKTGDITQSQGILVQPQQSTVSPFCTELTTITQELLDENGLSFDKAIAKLVTEYQPDLYAWASYGMFDLDMMKKQCESSGMHMNVKTIFAEKFGLKKPTSMKKTLNLLNIPLEGTHHRGVDDAKNIAKIMHRCLLK